MRTLTLLILLLLCGISAQAQTIDQLKKSMDKAQRDITKGNKLININKSKTSKTVNDIIITNRNISNRERIVKSGLKQVSIIKRDIDGRNSDIRSLSAQLKKEKTRYSKMMVSAYKNFLLSKNLFFILSANSIQNMYLRLYYLQRYSKMKIDLANSIRNNTEKLTNAVEDLSEKKSDLDKANVKVTRETERLKREKDQYNSMHRVLTKENEKLHQQMSKNIKLKKALENQIAKIIEEENRARSKKKLTEVDIKLSAEFSNNRGNLPHPIEDGIIVERFGTHRHPIYPTITVDSKGIYYATPNNTTVKSVFDGEVTRVFFVQGVNTVMVRHGEYISVYSGLNVVNVKKGDMISTGEVLGKISNMEDTPMLQLGIYKGKVAQNPENWLRD